MSIWNVSCHRHFFASQYLISVSYHSGCLYHDHCRSIIIRCWTTYAEDTKRDTSCGCWYSGCCAPAGLFMSLLCSQYSSIFGFRIVTYVIFLLSFCTSYAFTFSRISIYILFVTDLIIFYAKSNSGSKAKEDLAAATRAVQVCFFCLSACLPWISMLSIKCRHQAGLRWLFKCF